MNLKAGFYNLGGVDGSYNARVEWAADCEKAGHQVQFFTDQMGPDLAPEVSREVLWSGRPPAGSANPTVGGRPFMGSHDPTPILASAGAMTNSMQLFLGAIDCIRHVPSKLAQTFLTLDHATQGRGFYAVGAGEAKQLQIFGFSRKSNVRKLAEALELIRRLYDAKGDRVDFEGEFFRSNGGGLPCLPYGEEYPKVLGTPTPDMEIQGRFGDGLLTNITPGRHPIEKFRKDVTSIRDAAERAGRDPSKLYFAACSHVILHDDPRMVDEVVATPMAKWLTFSRGVNRGRDFRPFGFEPPVDDDWGYSNRAYDGSLDADQLREALAKVTPEMTKTVGFIHGTPEKAAEYYEEYADAGLTHVAVVPYATMGRADWRDINREMCARLISRLQGVSVSQV